MQLFRISKRRYAHDISGMGAARYPGRWNKKGTPVLYTGERVEIALLEIIVHLPPMICPQLDLLTIHIPDGAIESIHASDLPVHWYQFPAPTMLSEIGQTWIDKGSSLALKVPSSIIHTASIVLLNCAHPDFKKVRVVDQQPFYFDTRLRK